MTTRQWYCTVREVMEDLGTLDAEPVNFVRFVRSASQTLAGRVGDFIPVTIARFYDALRGANAWVDPLLSITSIVNNTDTLAVTDYDLMPSGRHWLNGPYSRICLEAKAWTDDVTITGAWGKYTLAEDTGVTGTHTGATDTTLTTSGLSTISPGAILLIESELVAVMACLTTVTYTVERGINGTTAVVHSTKAVYRQVVPDDVNYLAREMAALAYKKSLTGYTGRAGDTQMGESWYINEFPQAIKDLRRMYQIGYV
jgi:hypothetical protein